VGTLWLDTKRDEATIASYTNGNIPKDQEAAGSQENRKHPEIHWLEPFNGQRI